MVKRSDEGVHGIPAAREMHERVNKSMFSSANATYFGFGFPASYHPHFPHSPRCPSCFWSLFHHIPSQCSYLMEEFCLLSFGEAFSCLLQIPLPSALSEAAAGISTQPVMSPQKHSCVVSHISPMCGSAEPHAIPVSSLTSSIPHPRCPL